MKQGWIVVLEDRHADDEYFVCEEREDALGIANQLALWSISHYGPAVIDAKLYGNQIFRCALEDAFTVTVAPQGIRERGETDVGRG